MSTATAEAVPETSVRTSITRRVSHGSAVLAIALSAKTPPQSHRTSVVKPRVRKVDFSKTTSCEE